jgi:YbgC/YbaW family acyl-CoA thioester hydrolase
MKSIEIKRKVRWADVDASGRIYFPRIFDYAAEGEWELLHSSGLSRKELGKTYDFPRVHAECHFKKALELGDTFTLKFWVGKFGRTSIQYSFEIRPEKEPHEIAVAGSFTVVVVHGKDPCKIPAQIRAAFAD